MMKTKERSSLAAEKQKHESIARLLDWFFLLRPTLIFPLWTMLLAGHGLVKDHDEIGATRWLIVTISMSALFGLVYLLNQMRDREGDRRNGKSMLIANDLVSRKTQHVVGILLGIIAPAALIYSGFGHLGYWMIATFAVAGILYNYTPLALERTPVGGVLSGAIGGWLLLQLGELIAGRDIGLLRELPYILAFSAGCLLTSIPDLEGDRETGKRSFAVAFGERNTALFAGVMVFVAGLIGIFVRDWVVVVPAVACTILIALALKRRDYRLSVAGNKAAIFLLAMGIAIGYPYFLVAMVVYLPIARWYHWNRFGLDYPNFRAEYANGAAVTRMNSVHEK